MTLQSFNHSEHIRQFTTQLHASAYDLALVTHQLNGLLASTSVSQCDAKHEVETLFCLLLTLQQALCEGNSHIDLSSVANKRVFASSPSVEEHVEDTDDNVKSGYKLGALEQLLACLNGLILCSMHGKVLVLSGTLLYSAKYYDYEQSIGANVSQRINSDFSPLKPQASAMFAQLYPNPNVNILQAVASLVALSQPFYIINGGPGTGKTYTVIRTLLLLLAQYSSDLKIGLCAPTGKAAQRVSESIVNEVESLKKAGVATALLSAIPTEATTIHRLLKIRYGALDATYNQSQQLPFDVLVIDEVSMLDTSLLYRLLMACKSTTRLIFIGDTAQLPSVDVGAVLADLMPPNTNHFSVSLCEWIQTVNNELGTALFKAQSSTLSHHANYATTLHKNMRSTDLINDVANAVYNVDIEGTLATLSDVQSAWSTQAPHIPCLASSLITSPPIDEHESNTSMVNDTTHIKQFVADLMQFVESYYKPLITMLTPEAALSQIQTFRILTPIKQGMFGVNGINQLIDQSMQQSIEDRAKLGIDDIYHGRAILITQNDAQLNVFNGDSGVILLNEDNVLTAYIDRGKQAPLAISPYRLPKFESLYAMTIHKTQGSEFDNVLLVLPQDMQHGISRELLYTAITRAKTHLAIRGHKTVLTQAIKHRHKRNTGIVIEHSPNTK